MPEPQPNPPVDLNNARNLSKQASERAPDGSFDKLRTLLRELDDLSYEMLEHPKAGVLCGLIEKLQQWGCSASEHNWCYDQCGYWQHQYCIECNSSKYPDFARKSCGELTLQMGKMTEGEFLASAAVKS